MKHEFTKYTYLVHGFEIGNQDSVFENCYISDKDMSEKEVLISISADYIEKGYIPTSVTIDYTENIEIDLLTNVITLSDKQYI